MTTRALNDPALRVAATIADDFEGLSLVPYWDPVGYVTIGFGRLLSRKPYEDLSKWAPLESQEVAFEMLHEDMAQALMSVWRLIKVPLNDNQEAALADFTFNCGSGNLQTSTLRRVINRGAFDETPQQFMRWVYARGRKLNGLIRRRTAEAELFMA